MKNNVSIPVFITVFSLRISFFELASEMNFVRPTANPSSIKPRYPNTIPDRIQIPYKSDPKFFTKSGRINRAII